MIRSRADDIAEAMEERILTGEVPAGARLDESRLAEEFGVSRTPVREAFQRLTVSGLAEQQPHRGVFVRQIGPVELMEMFEVMAELEAVCGRFAAQRISTTALDELDAANQKCAAAVAASDRASYFLENEAFHAIIYRQAGNRFLLGEAQRLHRRLRPFRRLQLQARGRLEQSMSEHVSIVAALRAGDPDRTASALRAHVAVQGEKFHYLMASLRAASE